MNLTPIKETKLKNPVPRRAWSACAGLALALALQAQAQTLINVDFGVGTASLKTGMAAAGMGTNDHWNLYRHYQPRFTPGMPLVADGKLDKLRFADGSESSVSVAVNNAPGVWGNSSGDPMYDTYIFAQNGSNIAVTVSGLAPGRYHFYCYGHADPDVTGEQNSVFTLKAGTNTFGPLAQMGGTGWKAGSPWQDRAQYVVFRDVPVDGKPVVLEVAPGPNGVAVLNGLQIISRGTSPPRLFSAAAPAPAPASTNLLFREIHYDGKVSDTEARFAVTFDVESMTTNEISAPLFEGDVWRLALMPRELPPALRLVSQGRETRLFCTAPGHYAVKLDLVARIWKAEPWNQVSFVGPPAAIASVTATASTPGVEMQLGGGATQLEPENKAASKVSGFLGADRLLHLRWQNKAAEVARKSLVTVETEASAQITPTVVKFNTALHYEILQGAVPRLTLALAATQALTRIQGEQIRDWQVKPDGRRQVLTIEFIKPVEKACAVTLFSEQTIESTPLAATLEPPQPLEVERESGSFTLSADDTTVEVDSAPGLRQVNAPSGTLAAYRFNSRPVSIAARIQRITPVLSLADRVTARVEEARLVVSHALNLTVEKAGIYSLECVVPPGFVVSEVKGEGVDDWKAADGKLKISFASRVLGTRKLAIQLEQAGKEFTGAESENGTASFSVSAAGTAPLSYRWRFNGTNASDTVTILPLAVAGATNVTTQLGAASSPGIRLKTAELAGLREEPITSLPDRSDELLAFTGDQPGWKLTLAVEKLTPRVLAEVFNLATVGNGVVGGSATIRYGIFNQGVQEFRIAVPAHWKNLEFTGANIRRKEQQTNVWTITLQDKAWGGYTLVLTYDYQFDPKGGTLDLAGAHALGVERETGSLGLMTAATLNVTPAPAADPLRRVDEADLSESDRALCTRPLLLAYKYTGGDYQLTAQVTRFDELQVLDAVADRTELTSVLTDEGQLLTQSSFMVKNNEKQFQKFKLPKGAEFWSSYVNGQPAKPERDGDWLLVPLPRDANRDQAFAVDIVYAQKIGLRSWLFPRRVELAAPLTDIPNTYAEWQLFAPVSQRLTSFDGNMTVARGTTYNLKDAWDQFIQFYWDLVEHHMGTILFGLLAALVLVLFVAAARRGAQGLLTVLAVLAIVVILAAMLLPALSRAKSKAQRISAVNNLKQVALAAKTWAIDNSNALPPNFEAMKEELSTDKVTYDPNTGQRFVYVGAGKSADNPEAIIAYSPSDVNGRAVAFADGSVQTMSAEKFQEALQRDAALPHMQMPANAPASAPATPIAGLSAATPMPAQAQPAAAAPAPMTHGGAMGGGGAAAAAAVVAQPPARPTATGVRPIRIEVPRTGQSFSFTKVLNTSQEPLTASFSMMRLKVYRGIQMVIQSTAFVLGLIMLWWLLRRAERSSLWVTIALVLIIWSVARLLTMWRVLHVGLIAAVPILLFALVAWAAWKLQRRRRVGEASRLSAPPPIHPHTGGGAATASGTALLLAFAALALPARADEPAPPALTNTVSILAATYNGTVQDKVAQFDVTLQLATTATNQVVPLFGDDIALESFAAKGEARLVREGGTIGVLLPDRGKVELQLRLIARLGGDVTRRQLAFRIPPALASRVSVVIDEAEADVDFPTAASFERTSADQQTRVEAISGPADRLELDWTPRVKRAAEIVATVFVQNTGLVTIGGGVMNTRAKLDYQISQGELKQVRVQIPAAQRLLRVGGDSIRSWEIKDDTLVVDLLKGVSPAWQLTVETEKVLDKLPATARVELPHALDVKRETGLIALRSSEELTLAVENAQELQRVDAEEFYRAAPDKKDGILSAFRFLKTDFSLSVHAETVQPQVEAAVRNNVQIGSESSHVTAQVDYTIKKAGVFSLRLALPAGYRLESVMGDNVSQWVERNEDSVPLVEVALKERTIGPYKLDLSLAENFAQLPKALPIVGVHPLGAEKLSGYITVSTDLGVGAKTAAFEGLAEVPFASVPGERAPSGGSSLAYKFIATTPTTAPPWKLSVTTEAVEPWLRAEIMNTITLTETLVSGRTIVKYDIANAPVKDFSLRVPAEYKNVEITGAQIRRRDETNGTWHIELQSKVRGEYPLVVTWEMPRAGKTNLMELTGVQALGVEREAGYVAIVARPPLQVADQSGGELLSKIDVRELPPWAGQPDIATVLAYRYLRPGYKLVLDARRYDEAEVLQALIDNARLSTVVADDGQVMTELSLNIRNNGRQHLEVELPEKTTVWSAFVAGEPVRPSRRDGKLLLPLERDIASETPVTVELTFIGQDKFPKGSGMVSLTSPKFDLPLKNARWDLYLPPDYDYSKFAGSMNRASDAALPLEQVYSLSEYTGQQRAQEEQSQSAWRSGLESARKELAGNNLRQAVNSFNRAKSQSGNGKAEPTDGRELKQLEEEVRRAQGSNLINAQNDYFVSNVRRLDEQQALQLQAGQGFAGAAGQQQQAAPAGGRLLNVYMNYDADVASLQWDKLEKAQQVAVAKVAPLHVNLPTRGIRYSFTQVLQTEVRKPMTIRLLAENTRVPSWTARIGLAVLGFALLWAIVAALNRRKTVEPAALP
ncbi:MAG TPA: type II secretion system protein [Candidatus Acidoferrum sp.]|nr:type II secretion system protein [Candidatus Acidoferrum sp.]